MDNDLNPQALQVLDTAPVDLTLTVNGVLRQIHDIPGDTLLIDYLSESLRLTGTKFSCGIGACSACKVAVRPSPDASLIPVLACYARLNSLDHMEIVTVEGVGQGEQLHPLQQEFLDNFAFQCGYSTPGFVMAGYILIDQLRLHPIAEAELERYVLDAIGGHICRCTGYERYFNGICRTIRTLVQQGELRWATEPMPAASSSIRFAVRKRSRNETETKLVFGWFENPAVDVQFERQGDLSTLNATITLPFQTLRTGVRVRDLNVRQFLLAPYDRAVFSLKSARYLNVAPEPGVALSHGAVPVELEGTLKLSGAFGQPPSLPIRCIGMLSEVGGNQVRIVSSTPIEIDLTELGLALAEFAREFGLHLRTMAEVSFDIVAAS